MPPTFDWADNTPGNPTRFNNMNRWQIGGEVHPYWIQAFLGTPAALAENFLRWRMQRDVFVTMLTMGVGDNGTLGSTTVDFEDDGTSIGTLTIGNAGGPVAETSSDIRAAVAADSIMSVDVDAVATGLARLSVGMMVIPGKILRRIEFGFPCRIMQIEMMGSARANSGTTELLFKKNGTTITGGSLTATPSANAFETRATITAGNGDFGATDELTVELEQVSNGLRFLSWRAWCRTAVLDA